MPQSQPSGDAAVLRERHTIWVDVEDLFDYAVANPRPSGIQRLAFEIYRVLEQKLGPRVRFVRHDPLHTSFRPIPWSEITALFDELAVMEEEPEPAKLPPAAGARRARPTLRQYAAAVLHRMPRRMALPLRRFTVLQPLAMRAYRDLWRALLHPHGPRRSPAPLAAGDGATTLDVPALPPPDPAAEPPPEEERFSRAVAEGDCLLVLGAPWFHSDYGHLLATVRRRHKLHVALLLYDLIPLRRPEWCDRRLVRQFAAWFSGTIGECDTLFAISRASAEDVTLYARKNGIALPGPVRPIPIGTGFGDASSRAAAPVENAMLPEPGTYALFVSTIEARKNHILLFRVWRRLLDEMDPADVPVLVFAGRVGWLTADLMQQLDNADYLDGKIMLIRDPTDAELHALYAGCAFTVFPSLFEGWGLPVTESLALGKPCVISNCTSLPEAGGTLARYFDPDDANDASAAIRAVIEDPEGLAAWTERVRREFRPVPWSATADAILEGLPA